jgi:lipoate synthase
MKLVNQNAQRVVLLLRRFFLLGDFNMELKQKLPADIFFPDIDEATKQFIDATRAQSRALASAEPHPMTFNVEAIRRLTPEARAAFRYIWEREQQRYEEFQRRKMMVN